jgi:hypothetical protein
MVGGGVTVGSSSLAVVRSPLRIARCGARSNRRSQATVRSPILKPLPDCPFVRRHVRETDNRIGLRLVSGQAQIQPCTIHHAATAVRLSEVDASGDALSAPTHDEQTAASTLGMGRRIMAERRRPRTGRGRRHWARAQARNTAQADNAADASLRAFVRALARQAARECFDRELKQRSPGVQ